jgi:hypothetical protein
VSNTASHDAQIVWRHIIIIMAAMGGVLAWVKKIPEESLFIWAVTLSEIQSGIEITRAQKPEKAAEIEGGWTMWLRPTMFSLSPNWQFATDRLRVLKSPPRSPTANSICERVIGTIRRECLDWLIPLSEAHLRKMLKSWVGHYNHGRPHMALGPGIPDPPPNLAARLSKSRHRLDDVASVCSKAILGGLHHEYSLVRA